jgi:hypothetical protein
MVLQSEMSRVVEDHSGVRIVTTAEFRKRQVKSKV